MRLPLFFVVAVFCASSSLLFSQTDTNPSSVEFWVVKDISRLKIPSTPSEETYKTELTRVIKYNADVKNEVLQKVAYWNAGPPAYRWNELGYRLTGPELFSREKRGGNFWRSPMAWMNIAIYDATIAAYKLKQQNNIKRPYEVEPALRVIVQKSSSPSFPCEHSVTAGAAATVLAYFFPEKADSIRRMAKEACESRIYAGVQFPVDVREGYRLGEEIAMLVIEEAKKDGSDIPWNGSLPDDPKLWNGPYPVGISTANFKPIVLKTGSQFRPGPPPDFQKEMEEMKNFKQTFYTTTQAFYWASLSGLDYWTDQASLKIFENNLQHDALLCAKIYTMLHVAFHDVTIAIMDAKYHYRGIRPDQYDTGFKPLLGSTPPFPGYPSGHATASSAAATVLSYFFPSDAGNFEKAARECADSRFYAGIHFTSDNKAGIELGKKVGDYIIRSREKGEIKKVQYKQ